MRSRITWGAAVAALAVALAGCGGGSDQGSASVGSDGQTITIGVISKQTGPGAESYAGLPPAAAAWEKSVNAAGGVNGHQVKVELVDTGGDAAKGLAGARELVDEKKSVALVLLDGTTDGSIGAYIKGKGVPVLSPFAGYPVWYETPGWFPLGIRPHPEGNIAALKAISDSGAKSVGAVLCAEAAACARVDADLKEHAPATGLRYDGALKVAATTPSFTAQCLSLKNKGTEAVYMGLSPAASTKFAADCATQGYHPSVLFPFHTFEPRVKEIEGLKALAVLQTVPWYADVPATKEYRAAMSQYADLAKADESSMLVWASLEAVRTAGKNVDGALDKEKLTKALYGLKDVDLGGFIAPVDFTQGELAPVIKCYFVGGFENGEFTTPQGTDPKCLS